MIIISLKTTSLDPSKGTIISLGAVDLLDKDRTYYREYRTIPNKTFIEEAALEDSGFSEESIYDEHKPTFEETALEFIAWVNAGQCTLIAGYNVTFTIMSLRKNLEDADIDWPWGFHNVDLHTIAFMRRWNKLEDIPLTDDGESELNFNNILSYAGLNPNFITADSLDDAKIVTECFFRLLFEKHVFTEFED